MLSPVEKLILWHPIGNGRVLFLCPFIWTLGLAFALAQNFPESRNEGGEETQGTRQVLIGSPSRKKAPQEKPAVLFWSE